jgi:NAD(P)-dependent dehydrogenase (short-subunit alcohol dehydrogenase family)
MTIKPDLNGHTALVTGGSRGIGAAIALALAEAGAAVAVNYRERAAEANAVVARIKDMGGRAIATAADVSQASAVAKMLDQVASTLGAIDILVNNAGIAIVGGIDDLTESDFDATIAVNLKSAFLCTQAVVPAMRAKKWGRIVNISSGAARGGGAIGVAGQGRHHGQCGGAHADRNRHDARAVRSGAQYPAWPVGASRRSGAGGADGSWKRLHDRPNDRAERRHGVHLTRAAESTSVVILRCEPRCPCIAT